MIIERSELRGVWGLAPMEKVGRERVMVMVMVECGGLLEYRVVYGIGLDGIAQEASM